jgi:ADP-ribose pyrophosphatase YjhB (NUDIX family)
MIKVFTADKIIYLADNQTSPKTGTIQESIGSAAEMREKYNKLISNPETPAEIFFYNKELNALFAYFSSQFKIIEAAGGLVKNKKGEWLFIFRNGKWDLPKGKIEKGESIKEAAVREVEEECGIRGLKIIKELESTYHTYFIEEKSIIKRTYWFEMESHYTAELVPQTEEGITEVKWIAADNFKFVLDNTYDSIKEVITGR